jgi:hypothetical protein
LPWNESFSLPADVLAKPRAGMLVAGRESPLHVSLDLRAEAEDELPLAGLGELPSDLRRDHRATRKCCRDRGPNLEFGRCQRRRRRGEVGRASGLSELQAVEARFHERASTLPRLVKLETRAESVQLHT